jgi:predicted nucleic acid-binding protein
MMTSSPALVLDSWALLAHLLDEPCGPKVRAVLDSSRRELRPILISGMSLGEISYITERRQGRAAVHDVLSGLGDLGLVIIDPDRATILSAAGVKARHSISFGDAFVVALAVAEEATIVTGDPDFKKVEHLAPVLWLQE